MKNIIEQFYYGNITPCESTVPDNRFQKIVSDIDSIESEMLEQCPGIRKLLDQYRDKNGRLTGLEIENAFSKGFRLGTLFMSDVFSGKESLCEQTVHAEMPITKRDTLWGEFYSPHSLCSC